MIITLGRAGIHLDLFFYYPVNKLGQTNSDKIYSCLFQLIKPYNTSNKARQYDCVFSNYKPLSKRDFLGSKFWVPNNAEMHLESAYGSGWKKPQKSWDLFKDQKNLKLRGTAKDMKTDRMTVETYLKIKLFATKKPQSS
ncbi:MAG: hypothetical protein LC101_05270 [Flavobacteriales bacterium]|nr:hypothetical protein [Flavobacteriales bacterium]